MDQHDAAAAPHSLYGELLQLIALQARRVPIPLAAASALMAAMLAAYVPWMVSALWLLGVTALIAVRTRILTQLPQDRSRSEDRRLSIAAVTFAASGAAQASLLAFFPYVPVTIGAVISIYIVGVCAGTIAGAAGFRRIMLPYALCTMGPIGLVWGLVDKVDATLLERVVFISLTLVNSRVLLDHSSGAWRLFVESHDIRRQIMDLNQQMREALAAAESANRAKTRFLASASHDLRQPIHALSLFSGSLLLRPLDPRSTGIAEQIDKAVGTLASQLDALLDISKLDAGVIEKKLADTKLRSLLQQVASEFAPLADRKGLQLILPLPPDVQLHTDAGLLLRVLRNLLSNAIKYTETGSVRLQAQRSPRGCRIEIIDTGCGIPAEEQARVFEEFYQLNNPERDRSKGLGLGLAIVRRLTSLLDIDLQLQSVPGEGSCFSVDVPLAQGQSAGPAATADGLADAAPQAQVLVVDDEEAIRLGMQTLLEEMGFGVQVAGSSSEALACARAQQPDIVLADFRLRGDDDGMRVIRGLRTLLPGLPALLISGDTAPDRLREAHEAGIELLHKPVSALQLRRSLLAALPPRSDAASALRA